MVSLSRSAILIVAGPPHQEKVLAEALAGAGYDCHIWPEAQPLPDPAGPWPDRIPGLIIVPVVGGGGSGYRLCRQLKATPATAAVPVVFVGSFPDVDSRAEVFAAGGVDYLEQPIVAATVVARVAHQIEAQAAQPLGQTAYLPRPPLLQASLQRLHNSHDLDVILSTAVRDVQQQIQADRVLIYQFQHRGRGVITHEAVVDGTPPLLHQQVEDRCFDQDHAVKYWSGRVGQIDDLATLNHGSQCYRDMLVKFQVRANLVVPIIHNIVGQTRYLWGLIILHQCYQPRHWLGSDVDLLQELSAHLAIAIQQSRLFAQVRRQARQEMLLNRILDDIRVSLDVQHILTCTVEHLQLALGLHQCGITLLRHSLGNLPKPCGVVAHNPAVAEPVPPLQITESLLQQLRLDGDVPVPGPPANPLGLHQAQSVVQDQITYLATAICFEDLVQGVLWVCPGPAIAPMTSLSSGDHGAGHHSDLRLIEEVAMQLSQALRQATLYQQLQTANDELQRLAHRDGLTQIANRREFDRYLSQEWQRLQREQGSLALVLADVDYFKGYNDTYGHLAGDDCLRSIGQVLTQVTKRPADLAARYGGEEFVLILPNTNTTGAIALAAEVQTQLTRLAIPNLASPLYGQVTLSFGIAAAIPSQALSTEVLIQRADKALYTAKENGRNRYCLWPG